MRKVNNREPVDIIIPTYNNINQLQQCLDSMWCTKNNYPMRFIIINNGNTPIKHLLPNHPDFVVIDTGKNLGWTGGLEEGLKHCKSKYVMFANDDIFVPKSSYKWLVSMTRHLEMMPGVAAVGPSSNLVSGSQNIWRNTTALYFCAPYLIGFCMLVRRSTLDEVGGVDTSFATGDDIDLSITFQKSGYSLFVDASVFVYHHGFQTGEKVYGKPSVDGGWNSTKMIDETNMALIKKHGFIEWWITMTGQEREGLKSLFGESEEEIVKKHIPECKPEEILEVGCGPNKTIPGSIAVDVIPKGERIFDSGLPSVADVVANIEEELPFEEGKFKVVIARHVLEHCIDTMKVFENWKRVLSSGGKVVLCCPDENKIDSIIMNPEHCHAFTPESLAKLSEKAGFVVDTVKDDYNTESFLMVLSKGE